MPDTRKGEFALIPFQEGFTSMLNITGTVTLHNGSIEITYTLDESPKNKGFSMLWPPASGASERRDELWTSTCLELFLSTPTGKSYWEYNFSPSGDWNIYYLNDYRNGLTPEPVGIIPTIDRRSREGHKQLSVVAPLPKALLHQETLVAAVTAVVKQQNGEISYWALHHGGQTADFHRRDGFQLNLTNKLRGELTNKLT